MKESIVRWILYTTIIGSTAVTVVMMVRVLGRKLPKKWMMYLWVIVLFRFFCPWGISAPFSVYRLVPLSAAESMFSDSGSANSITTIITEQDNEMYAEAGSIGEVDPFSNEITLNTRFFGMGKIVCFYIWSSRAAVLLLIEFIRMIKLRKRLSSAEPILNQVFLTDAYTEAFILGIVHPRIYVPAWADETERNHMINHERTHLNYGDHILKATAVIMLIFHWFNPFCWLAFYLFSYDIETACDERLLEMLPDEERIRYSRTLLQAIRKNSNNPAVLHFGHENVKERIMRILKYKKPGKSIIILTIMVFFLVAVVVVTNKPEASAEYNSEVDMIQHEEKETDDSNSTVLPSESGGIVTENISEPELDLMNEKDIECFLQENSEEILTGAIHMQIPPRDTLDVSMVSFSAPFYLYEETNNGLVQHRQHVYYPVVYQGEIIALVSIFEYQHELHYSGESWLVEEMNQIGFLDHDYTVSIRYDEDGIRPPEVTFIQ